ncbi:MAG: LCP family protein [Lachnospiraceae bacterium]|jgi:LCP family protein required for cell wall assembly
MKRTPTIKRRNRKPLRTVITVLLVTVAIIVAAIAVLSVYMTEDFTRTEVSDEDFGIAEEDRGPGGVISFFKKPDIMNIVFLGIDEEENRSDVIMILSFNKGENTLKLISLLRDSKVAIEGCEYETKIGYAYKWGGSAFAVRTINRNFNTNFNQFITMDFEGIAGIVDSLGGVEVELLAEEAQKVNEGSAKLGYEGYDAVEGLNVLNGPQAVAFSRIRSAIENDGEHIRVSRQQTVIEGMLAKIRTIPKYRYPSIIRRTLNCLETTLTYSDMIYLASMDVQNLKMTKYTIPDEEFETDLVGGWEQNPDWEWNEYQWVWIYDLKAASERLKSIIYEEQE